MNSRWFRMRVAATCVIGLVACSEPPVGPGAAPEEHLLFLSTRAGAVDELGRPMRDIYRMNADGSDVRNLTMHPSRAYDGVTLSPDGRRIAFVSFRDSPGCDIWVMNTDGTNQTRLTGNRPNERCNSQPRWSRDGTRIAFVSNREMRQIGSTSGLYDVYVMNADGSNPKNVSHSLGTALGHGVDLIGWSPAGQIVFETNDASNGVIQRRVYVVNTDGTGLVPLFDRVGDHSPAWSPDGSLLAFISDRNGTGGLYIMRSDGTDVRSLTNTFSGERLSTGCCGYADTWFDIDPWSPDGKSIAFERIDRVETFGVYTIRADGTGLRRLTNFPASFNGWSASGDRIALTRRARYTPHQSLDVIVINADGSNLRNLTGGPSDDTDALWIRN